MEQQVWQQLDSLQKQQQQQQQKRKTTTSSDDLIERMRAALDICPAPKIYNPLQHKCSIETKCDWLFVDSEWAICTASASLHRCTVTECQFRDETDQKGHGGYSVCMLTARAMDTTEFVQAGWVPFKRHAYGGNAVDKQRQVAQAAIEKALVNKAIDKKRLAALSLVCTRLWSVLGPQAVGDFESLCVYALIEMADQGLGFSDGETMVQVLPRSAFLAANLRPIEGLRSQGLKWKINISKSLCTAIIALGEKTLRELAHEFAGLPV